MRLGIIQGRLSSPVGGKIQEFPMDCWEGEFSILKHLNLNHIEWIITKKSFNEKVTDLKIGRYSTMVSSICCDHVIDEKIIEIDFLEENLSPVCEWALKNKITSINIPLLEESKITNENKEKLFNTLILFSKKYKNINFNFEIESDIKTCLELVTQRDNLFLVYDTGNITSCGFDSEEWITKGFNYIRHVHLKDRTISPVQTVEPLKGDTNFVKIFDLLKNKNYNYYYTIQTCRGEDGKESETIKKHVKIFKELYGS
jgi:hypothetical protein